MYAVRAGLRIGFRVLLDELLDELEGFGHLGLGIQRWHMCS